MKTLVLIAVLVAPGAGPIAGAQTVTAADARAIAEETYIWGYPLVTMDLTRKVQTNIEAPSSKAGRAPLNQFAHSETFPPATFRDFVRPNFDTLYSFAWLDLGSGPLVMTLPKTDRYHVFQMMDGWSEVFAAPGTRMTGGRGGNFLIVGPAWRGNLPKDMELLRSATDHVWVIGRIQTNGPGDYDFVHKLQAQIKLTPLSQWGKRYVPPEGRVDPKVDMKTPPLIAVNRMDGEAFFTALMEALKKDPPLIHDQTIVARMKRIGLEPGKSLDFKALPAPVRQALNDGPTAGLKAIQKRIAVTEATAVRNGWFISTGAVGSFGGDYSVRATTALLGLGANRPEDAVYPMARTDGEGRPLSGANRYVLHFPKGQTPPVAAFWSLTLYDDNGFPVENAIKRHAIGDRDKLKFNDDGSLTLYIQHQSPGVEKESNWLPAPEGVFTLTMRCYSPRPQIAIGEWVPPPVKRVD
jgi:hypothetical protein